MANEQNLRAGNGRKPRATTLLKKAFDIYYREVEPTAKESSKEATQSRLNGFFEYCKEIGKDSLSMLSQKGLNDYQAYCLKKSEEQQKKGKNGISNQRIKRRYDVICMLINKVLTQHNDFLRYKIPLVRQSTIKVAEIKGEEKKRRPLMPSEIEAISNVQGLTEEEKEFRDLFLIECNCSYRISDTPKMFDPTAHQIHTINGREYMTFETQKEGITTVIWLTDELKQLLKKFDGGFKFADPSKNKRTYTNKMNRLLRRIFEKAGLNKMESFKDQFGKIHQKPTCEVITSHWARYTFIYNGLFTWGLTSEQLKTFTAHADHKMIDEVYNVYAKNPEKLVEQADKALQKVGLVDKAATTHTETNQVTTETIAAIEKRAEERAERELINDNVKAAIWLGLNPCDVMDCKNLDQVNRLLYKIEYEYIKAGIDPYQIKRLWQNKSMTFKEKKKALLQLMKLAKNE